MENNKVTTYTRLKDSEIDMHNVFLSVIKQALVAGVLSQERMEELQFQLMTLTGELVGRYTNGQSSSVKTETAQRILSSAVYIIDLGLMRDFSAERVAERLCTTGIPALHSLGIEAVQLLQTETEQWMQKIQQSRLDIDMISYNESIDEIASAFCTTKKGNACYDPWYDARNSVASIDYPLLKDDMSWEGILYIRNYLRSLTMESRFCQLFEQQEIIHLMSGVAKNAGISKTELLVNIAESVLLNALCNILMNKSALRLRIYSDELVQLYDTLYGDRNTLKQKLEKAFDTLTEEIGMLDRDSRSSSLDYETCSYLKSCLPRFAVLLENAVEQTSLHRAIVVEQTADIQEKVQYSGGQRMSDERLREVIKILLECDNGQQKLEVILQEIRSIEDLVELFGAFCIFVDEYQLIFDGLDDVVLAALAATLLEASSEFSHAFSEQSPNMEAKTVLQRYFVFDPMEHTEHQRYWMECLTTYLLGSTRAEVIITQAILTAVAK